MLFFNSYQQNILYIGQVIIDVNMLSKNLIGDHILTAKYLNCESDNAMLAVVVRRYRYQLILFLTFTPHWWQHMLVASTQQQRDELMM
jgi:hypothetical protein